MNKSLRHFFWLMIIPAVLLARISLHGATAEAQSETKQPPLPPTGKLVDIGGWRLHLNCTGEPRASQPTVILEAGNGNFSVEWSLVQPRVAGFARVCSYDRAGAGWSELGPHPRTMRQTVFELHTLLEEDERKKIQAEMAKLSRNGKQIIAVGSGHHIHIEDPELGAKAIRDVVTATRK